MPALILSLALLLLAACTPDFLKAEREPDSLFGPSEGGRTVVEAILLVDRPLPPVFLRRTVDPGVPYDPEATGVAGATVAVLSDDEVFAYRPDPTTPGRYLPPDDAAAVQPDRRYRLRAGLGADETVEAETHTPERLDIEGLVLLDDDFETEVRRLRLFSELGDAVYQAPENQLRYTQGGLEVRLGRSGNAASYQFAVANLERNSPLLFDADLFDEDEDDFDRRETSPLLGVDEDGIFLSWDGLFFAGRYKAKLFAVDQNWFDLVRTDNVDSDRGSGEAGQDFQRPLFRVDNGIGLFASAAVDSFGFFVRAKDSPPCTGCECWGCNNRGTWTGALDLNTRRGRVSYERTVSSGADCALSYEISHAVGLAPCAECAFAWELTLGRLLALDDLGGCDEIGQLSGLRFRFAQGAAETTRAENTPLYSLFGVEDDAWERIEDGWSLVATEGEAAGRWLFGFEED